MAESPRSVIGVALNFRESLPRLQPPLPQAPVLYLKTPNTWIEPGTPIPCPAGVTHLRMAGTLGVLVGRSAFVVVNDISIPHDSYFRPAIRQRCSDGFCSIGEPVERPSGAFEIQVYINGGLRSTAHTSSLLRPIDQLIQDISEFMTLRTDDILLIGEPDNSPLAVVGDHVRVVIPGLGEIGNQVVAA